jgi:perosamine synthetase
MSDDISIRRITKENLPIILSSLMRLENNWTGIGETPWKEENFTLDLKNKWDVSIYAEMDGRTIGYIIGSSDNGTLKLNKILVDQSVRGRGLGTRLWNEFISLCRKTGLPILDFKVHVENEAAIGLYRKMGCLFIGTELGPDNRRRYLNRYVFRSQVQIPHSRPAVDEADAQEVHDAVFSGNLATGLYVEGFLSELKGRTNRSYGVAVSSGTSALHLALRALDVTNDDEVIMPSYVCYSVLSAVRQCGAVPVLVDINSDDPNISLADTRRRLTKKTKAIIIPHMFGRAVRDIEEFKKLGVHIIEDCAQGFGMARMGSHGLISVFSFYATKFVATATGGAVLTDDKMLYDRMVDLTTYDGRMHDGECYNYRMSDLQASLGRSQIKKMDSFIARRKVIAKLYSDMLSSSDLKLPQESLYFRFVVRHPDAEAIIANMRSRGVDAARPVFMPLHNYLNLPDIDFPNASAAHRTSISIPIYPDLTDSQATEIAGIIQNWRSER